MDSDAFRSEYFLRLVDRERNFALVHLACVDSFFVSIQYMSPLTTFGSNKGKPPAEERSVRVSKE